VAAKGPQIETEAARYVGEFGCPTQIACPRSGTASDGVCCKINGAVRQRALTAECSHPRQQTNGKVLVLYYSAHIERMVGAVAEGVREAGAEAVIKRVISTSSAIAGSRSAGKARPRLPAWQSRNTTSRRRPGAGSTSAARR
jgi:hypothetical protein